MNRIAPFSLAPAAASDNNIAQSQTPGAAGNLTLNGSTVTSGVATLDIPRRVLFTAVSDESAKTITVTGTDRNGRQQSETLAGPNATTGSTLKDYKTITQIAVSAAFTGAVKAGTGGVISTQWFPVDRNRGQNVGFDIQVTGTINYTVEHTQDDPFSADVGVLPNAGQGAPYLTPYPHATIAAQTANKSGAYTGIPVTAVRVTINSYSTGATLAGNFAPGPMER